MEMNHHTLDLQTCVRLRVKRLSMDPASFNHHAQLKSQAYNPNGQMSHSVTSPESDMPIAPAQV